MLIKKILIVVESLDSNHSSGIKGRIALINNLKECGYQLKVYHYSRIDIAIPDIESISIPEKRRNIFYILSRLQRLFTRITKKNINPFVESILGFSFTFFSDVYSIKKALKKEIDFNPDWVLTLSYASSFRPHRALLSIPKWHKKWLAYVHDPYPMHSYPRPYDWVEPGHQYKRKFFLEIVEKSKFIVYPSKLLADWMESYYPKQKGKEIIIPHQISKKEIESVELPTFFESTKFNILHAGSLMSARKPYGLINAFELFLKEIPEAKIDANLIFVGKNTVFENYMLKKQIELPQLIVSDYLPFQKVYTMQKTASVNVIIEAKGSISPFLPGKMPHIISVEKPILLLGPIYSESKRLLSVNFDNWSEIDDEGKIKEIIIKLYKNWKGDIIDYDYSFVKEYLSLGYLKNIIDNLR